MSVLKPREFLMIPGPTPVPDAVLEAIARHPIGHRTPDFSKALKSAVENLQWLGQTKHDVFVLTASGTAALELAIFNTISPADDVLCVVNGVFGERWARMSEALGAKVERLSAPAGQAVSVKALEQKLEADKEKKFKAVIITHNETSTGVVHDIQPMLAAIRKHGALSIVDTVTSFGAVPFPIDEWQADIVATGSQKALMLPPGLSFVFFGPRAWDAHKLCKTPRFYLDAAKYKKSMSADTTPFTPNVSLVMGLQVALQMMKEEGTESIFARHKRLQKMTREGLKALNLELFVAEDCASSTITAVYPPANIGVDVIRKGLKEKFRILVADGQEELKGKIFRIGHMGYVFERDVLMTLAALESVLIDNGHRCEKGAAVSAALRA
ncbi:MAG: alanine--glyoxylate aminotransferase family protein [Candidatus Obscuribacterales bacterium]|nr:alanine--glyoxylate aminotransferase family protein [Candidatus Obscuribacterales bacterium]